MSTLLTHPQRELLEAVMRFADRKERSDEQEIGTSRRIARPAGTAGGAGVVNAESVVKQQELSLHKK